MVIFFIKLENQILCQVIQKYKRKTKISLKLIIKKNVKNQQQNRIFKTKVK